MKKLMFLIDVYNNEAKPVEADGLDDYYELIGCDLIDIVNRAVGNRRYAIIADDEGLLKANPKISAIDNFGFAMLVGNLLIANDDIENGELKSLDVSDIVYLKERVIEFSTKNHPEPYGMLTQVEY